MMADVKVLSVSDKIEEIIYSPHIRQRFADIEMVIACGDLPYYYVEYIVSALNVPVFTVRGNHSKIAEASDTGTRHAPHGAIDLHRKTYNHCGVLLAGVEGSIRYNDGPFQYTQDEMWRHVFSLVPGLIHNKIKYGRYLDIFVSHASPWGIHDKDDWPHQGIKAYRWLLEVFKPGYHFHGHIHLYGPNQVSVSTFQDSLVINAYGYRKDILKLPNYQVNRDKE